MKFFFLAFFITLEESYSAESRLAQVPIEQEPASDEAGRALWYAEKCSQAVEEEYKWARWVILGGIVVFILVVLLPFACCACVRQKIGLWILIGMVALVALGWIIFSLVADSLIFAAFKHVFASRIC